MRIAVTGAAGFIGAYVLREAVARGHRVIAVTRGKPPEAETGGPVEWRRRDLANEAAPLLAPGEADALVHLAADLSDRPARWRERNLAIARNVLATMRLAGVRRLVGVSSIAVLDYAAMPTLALIDERAPVPADARSMSAYADMKLAVERLLGGFGAEPGCSCAILRPGLVYDRERLIGAHAGVLKGSWPLLAMHRGEVPTVQAGALARAILNAVECAPAGDATPIHLVDDRLPSQRQYLAGLRRRGLLRGAGIRVPWWTLAALAAVLNRALRLAGLGGRLPELLRANALAARLKPFRYSNAAAKRRLAWRPADRFS